MTWFDLGSIVYVIGCVVLARRSRGRMRSQTIPVSTVLLVVAGFAGGACADHFLGFKETADWVVAFLVSLVIVLVTRRRS